MSLGRALDALDGTAPARAPDADAQAADGRQLLSRDRDHASATLSRSHGPDAENPLRVAIVGSGPAGFYAAEHLLKQEEVAVEVDMFDRLPTPYGLVRAGVAPDHPKIKSVIRVYEKTAARPGFRFFGNVEVGKDVSVAELRERYHAVLFAYGTSDRPPPRHPGRGPARQPLGHRVRQLVQRPPRLRRRTSSTSPASAWS